MNKYLLLNPWIYDFAAYDFGIKPIGLLRIASYLRASGDVYFLDCLAGCARSKKKTGFSKFRKEKIDKPAALKDIKRPYFKYGISIQDFKNKLLSIKHPDAIFVSSGMTF
ncbi:MAG: hypothetical protein COS99_08460 [Candidatus Omnitrophica bacterium CG07_land_8_20_14_0_80_42_15]|uniref:Radical SAM protein n=1 Tax=Candidatus Aquitaenariimonas noxiae TaxID=1974741 RepID=A0A2J0KYM2_9BACT|nr:MAG: hypothetical protein COS99_08460 [Candidatus Omnitrophica bacterium CG07_land_8_20_14_0_80_42_15]